MIRFAVIGTSAITDKFITGSRLVEGFSLKGVYSRSMERAIEYGTSKGADLFFDNLETLASCNDIDAVYIASPNACHFEQSKLMLSHGKHVICEKPITVTERQFAENLVIAEKNGVIYMEAIMGMHQPQRQIVAEAIPRLGKICGARLDFSRISTKYDECMAGKQTNIFDPGLAAGTLMDLGIYVVYPAVDLFGIPDDIFSAASFMHTGADCSGSSIFMYKDKVVTLTYAKTGTSYMGSEIYGDKGTLHFDSISQMTGITFISPDGKSETLCGEVDRPVLMANETRDFCRYINDPSSSASEYGQMTSTALNVVRTMEKMRQKSGIVFEADSF